jgi:hypothetical protein
MSGLMDKVTDAAQNKLGKDSQPGDKVESGADNAVNQGRVLSQQRRGL